MLTKHPETSYSFVKLFNMYRPHCKSENLNLKRLSCGLQCHKILNKIIQPYKNFQTVECICIENEKGHTINKQVIDCKTRKWKTQPRMPNKYCTSTAWYKPCLQASKLSSTFR